MDVNDLRAYLAADTACAAVLGGKSDDWQIAEVGDGNLNLVFSARGPAGGLAVKQSLPYLRLVGESWPLPLERAYFENLALQSQMRLTPGLVPNVLCYDEQMFCIVMEYLSPHIIMRQGMIAATVYPKFAEDLSEFAARNLFFTSDLHLDAPTKRAGIAEFSKNQALCKITEDVIFTEPYMLAEQNRWTKPYLDGHARRFREDGDLKVAISRLKLKYLSETQALLHGDLHTGSVMITPDSTKVIDPEFAFYGPMGFDVGKIIANLLLNYFSQTGHEAEPGLRDDYRRWILATVGEFWDKFAAKFLNLWRDPKMAVGDGYPVALFSDTAGQQRLEQERQDYMRRLWLDAVGFAGSFMVRRILGIAHNIDLEHIADEHCRARCEARALDMARELMLDPGSFNSADELVSRAQQHNNSEPQLTDAK